jgi:NAD(P)-dependent dehydrogenase (short-subunit alcohol dehydrogenase family)
MINRIKGGQAPMLLKDKVAIVTGSTYGIGKAVATEFASEGAKVVIHGRNVKRGEEVQKYIQDAGGTAFFIKADLTSSKEIRRLIEKTVDRFGKLDILYNNAAIQLYKGIEDTTEEEWDRTFDINVKSYFLCSKYAIPEMEKVGKGVIINTGSVVSFCGMGSEIAYVSTKHAIIGLTREMAIDLIKKNIRVLAICPGTTNSGLLEGYIKAKNANIEEFNKLHLPNRVGEPREIAKVAAFLASDNAGWIIGAPIMVDGGYTVR